MEDERREFNRYTVKKDKLKVLSPNLKIVGKLKNISKGGLSFQYTPNLSEKLDINSINIIAKGANRLNIFDSACRIIYDISALEENGSLTGAVIRQCGIEFFTLKDNQKKQLSVLLKNYTL